MSSRRSFLLRRGALLMLPFALAACSSSTGIGSSSVTGAGDASSSAAASSAPADPDAGLLNGTRLKTLLLPVSVLPKGYHVDKQGTRDSKDLLESPIREAVDLSSVCPKLEQTAWIRVAGIGEAAFAQGDFLNAANEEFNEEVDSFRGTDARTVMGRLEQAFAHCAHFTTTTSGTKVSVRVQTTKVPGVGDETVKAVMSAPQWYGGTTLVATRVGNVVITTFYNVQSSDMGAAGLRLTEQIAARVKAAG